MRWKLRAAIAGGCWVGALVSSYALQMTHSEWARWAGFITTFAAVAFTLRAIFLVLDPWTFIRALWLTIAIYAVSLILFCGAFAVYLAAQSNLGDMSVNHKIVSGVAALTSMALFIVGFKYVGTTVGLWLLEDGRRQGIDRAVELSGWVTRFRAEFRRPETPAAMPPNEMPPSPPSG